MSILLWKKKCNLGIERSHLVRFPGNLDAHLEMKEKCGNFRFAREIFTGTFGVYEGECRTCLYWPPDGPS
jgi:hypothetical protein